MQYNSLLYGLVWAEFHYNPATLPLEAIALLFSLSASIEGEA